MASSAPIAVMPACSTAMPAMLRFACHPPECTDIVRDVAGKANLPTETSIFINRLADRRLDKMWDGFHHKCKNCGEVYSEAVERMFGKRK